MRRAGHVALMREKGDAYRVVVGKSKVKRPLGRPRSRWKDMKMDNPAVGWGSMDWIDLAQNRNWWWAIVNALMNLLMMKANEMHYFSDLFDKVLYIFRTSPLSITRSNPALYTRNRYLSC